jgi:hypothetical protein
MSNLIQIKRSATAAAPGSLANGELAFTSNGDILYIGSPNGSVVAIGGLRSPGVLTANHALVANSTSGIDKVIVANLVPTGIWANGSAGSTGQVLTSNSSGGVFWSSPSAGVAGSNTQVQFNDQGLLAGDADFTFSKVNNTLTVANIAVSGATISSNTTTGALTVGGGLGVAGRINVTDIAVGNDSVFATVNNTVITTNNLFATGTVNGSVVGVGTFFRANTTQVAIGTGVSLIANGSSGGAGQILHSNGSSIYWNSVDTGVTSVATGSGLTGGPILTTGTVSVLANNGIVANTSGLFVQPGTGTVVNSTGVHVNSSYIGTLSANNADNLGGQPASFYTNATNLATGTVPTVRLGTGTANSTTFLSGDQSYKTAVTSITSGDGLSGGPISTTGTLSVQAGDGVVSNSSGVFVRAGTGVTVNSTGVHVGQNIGTTSTVTFGTLTVTGNTALGDATTDVVSINASVNTSIMPAANVTYSLGNNTMRWSEVHVANVHSVTGKFDGSVEIAGSLTVTGTVSNVSVVDLVVSDPLIHIGANNETSDIVDLGWVGHYSDDAGVTRRHAGIFRDATDGEFKVFTNLVQADLDTANALTINTAAASYSTATLHAYLTSGGLTTNSSTIAITANSTVNVAIIANTLILTTALTANGGGTGRTTIANNALLVGNATSGYNELTLGSSGHVLQSNGTALIYNSLDGGSF